MSALVELLVLAVLLLLNAGFALAELAIVTARRVRLESRAEDGDPRAGVALALAAEPTQFLATVQFGITLVSVSAGAFGGARLADRLAPLVAQLPGLGPYAPTVAFALVVTAITFVSLLVGELIPKRVALAHPEAIALVVARPMTVLARVGGPIVRTLSALTTGALRLLGISGDGHMGAVTEDEIRAMVEQGAESGVVEAAEHAIVERVFTLGDRTAGAIMTPRPDVGWVALADGLAGLRTHFAEDGTSQVIVCRDSLDDVVGVLHAEDLVLVCLPGPDGVSPPAAAGVFDPTGILKKPLYVPASHPALDVLDALRRERAQVALVVDEHGQVAGAVTLDRLLAAIVGALPMTTDREDAPEIQSVEPGLWHLQGTALVDDVADVLDLEPQVLRGDGGFHTIAGYVFTALGRIPVEGDLVTVPVSGVEAPRITFEVTGMDGRRIAALRMRRTPPLPLEGPGHGSAS